MMGRHEEEEEEAIISSSSSSNSRVLFLFVRACVCDERAQILRVKRYVLENWRNSMRVLTFFQFAAKKKREERALSLSLCFARFGERER